MSEDHVNALVEQISKDKLNYLKKKNISCGYGFNNVVHFFTTSQISYTFSSSLSPSSSSSLVILYCLVLPCLLVQFFHLPLLFVFN